MKLCIEIIIALMLSYTIFAYIRTKIFLKKVSKQYKKQYKTNNKKIVIAIPVLREQKCICDTVKYFKEIAQDIPIILITTQKEINENKNKQKTTQDIINEKILGKYENVYCINFPGTKGYMADQINYMLEHLEEILNSKVDLKNTYLALYNADSRPNEKTFEEIKEKIEKGNKVIQQYSYCMKNYEKLSYILKGFAIYQSNFELKTGLINSYFDSRLLYTHVVGHGLIIELETLKKLGNFNTTFWCEDVYLGLQLKFNNIKITPILSLENIETPDNLKKLIKQNSVWFKTTSQFLKIYKDIQKRGQAHDKISGRIGTFNEFRCAINWLFFPIMLLVLVIGAILTKEYNLLLVILISYCIYISINTISTIKIINVLDNKRYNVDIKTIISVLLATSISNIGPIYSIVVNKKEKYKTER